MLLLQAKIFYNDAVNWVNFMCDIPSIKKINTGNIAVKYNLCQFEIFQSHEMLTPPLKSRARRQGF